MLKIWQKYFIVEFVKFFLLFLICFYTFFVLIDFASRTSSLPHRISQVNWPETFKYYGFIFSSRAEILVPVALLIAFVKTITTLNVRQEIVALMAGGFSKRQLLRPFLFISFFATTLLFMNEQWVLPTALKSLRRIEDGNKQKKTRNVPDMSVKNILLENKTLLLFQEFNTHTELFFDVFWIESPDSIYRMKYLSPDRTGFFVDHILREPGGELVQKESFEKKTFPGIRFNQKILQSSIQDPEAFALTEFISQLPKGEGRLNEKESKLQTAFYWKLMTPWLCCLSILAPATFCMHFSRRLPVFFLYMGSLFSLIAFYMLMDAFQVISKRQVIPPFWAVVFPFLSCFLYFSYRYFKKIA